MAPRSACAAIALTLLALALGQPAAAASAGPAKGFGRTADPLEGAKNAIRLKNFTGAQSDLQRLADAGNAEAQYLLAVFFLNGLGGPRDLAQAKLWLEKSAAQGNARAAFMLAETYDPIVLEKLGELGLASNVAMARIWYSKAKDLGSEGAPECLERLARRSD